MISKGRILTVLFFMLFALRSVITDVTTFDASYKIFKKEVLNSEYKKYLLYCENEWGRFKINVDSETYNKHNINDNIRYDRPFTSISLYDYALDEKSKNNIISSVTPFESVVIKNPMLQALFIILPVIGAVYLVILICREFYHDYIS